MRTFVCVVVVVCGATEVEVGVVVVRGGIVEVVVGVVGSSGTEAVGGAAGREK